MTDTLEIAYNRIRIEEQDALRARIADAYARAPQLSALDERRAQALQDAGAGRRNASACAEALAAADREERAILASLGLPCDYLALHFRCAACRDTGFVGDAPKRPCACRLRMRESLLDGTGINERETFAAFSESIYPDDTQRRRALNAAKLCGAYAEALPYPEKPNLLLLGMPGLGKSYLGNAVAYEAISRGVDAMRVTAYAFVQAILQGFQERGNPAARFQSVPLLVLDDLGSEPDITNVSTEWLFAVVNERMAARRATVFITNLSLAELNARYGERVMSRLVDKSMTTALQLTGSNLRMQ